MIVTVQQFAQILRQRPDVADVDVAHVDALGASATDRLMDRAIGAAPTDHRQLAASLTQCDLLIGDRIGHAIDLGLAGIGHGLVAAGRIVDIAGAGVLLDSADAVHQARRARRNPRAGALLVTRIGQHGVIGAVLLGQELCRERGIVRRIWHQPRLGRVGDVAIGQQDHRGHELDRDTARFDGAVERIRWTARGDHRHRRIAIAAVDRLIEVGLLGLGRQAC